MSTRLIIARHGNTFTSDQTPTRVGARTDLPLVASGQEQAKRLGLYLKENNLLPDEVYASSLRRTQETAQIALDTMGLSREIIINPIFNEIDYGPDENQPEDSVIARIGKDALRLWDENAIPPKGWVVSPEKIKAYWMDFANQIRAKTPEKQKIVLVLTSNGIARFAPFVTSNFNDFKDQNTLKLSTGSLGIIDIQQKTVTLSAWNIKP